jgi:hypothetical protein
MKSKSAVKRMKKVVEGVAWYSGVPWSKYTYEHLGWSYYCITNTQHEWRYPKKSPVNVQGNKY